MNVMCLFLLVEIILCTKNKVKIIQTTDIHGWIYGHPHIPALNADIADYLSFTTHIKNDAAADEVVLIFDSGDLSQGTGLSDATSVPGSFIFDAFQSIPADAITLGNHELYQENTVENIADKVYLSYNGRVISGNVAYVNGNKTLADKFLVKEILDFGKVLVFGFLLDFDRQARNVVVGKARSVITQKWFIDALEDNKDARLVVILGHFGCTSAEADTYVYAIKDNWEKSSSSPPIILLGGHTHVQENYTHLHTKSIRIQSRAFFQEIGVLDLTLDDGGVNIEDFRLAFLETSREKLYAYTKKTSTTFTTPAAAALRERIAAEYAALSLGNVVGCSPQTYSNSKVEGTKAVKGTSIYQLVVDEVFPTIRPMEKDSILLGEGVKGKLSEGMGRKKSEARKSNGKDESEKKGTVYLMNAASLRSIFPKGTIVNDDIYCVEPFNNPFVVVRNVSKYPVQRILYYMDEFHSPRFLAASSSSANTASTSAFTGDTDFAFASSSTSATQNTVTAHQSPSSFAAPGLGDLLEIEAIVGRAVHPDQDQDRNQVRLDKDDDYSVSNDIPTQISPSPTHAITLTATPTPVIPNTQFGPQSGEGYFVSSNVDWDSYESFDVVTGTWDIGLILPLLQDTNMFSNFSIERAPFGIRDAIRVYVKYCMQCGNIKVGKCTLSYEAPEGEGGKKVRALIMLCVFLFFSTVIGFVLNFAQRKEKKTAKRNRRRKTTTKPAQSEGDEDTLSSSSV